MHGIRTQKYLKSWQKFFNCYSKVSQIQSREKSSQKIWFQRKALQLKSYVFCCHVCCWMLTLKTKLIVPQQRRINEQSPVEMLLEKKVVKRFRRYICVALTENVIVTCHPGKMPFFSGSKYFPKNWYVLSFQELFSFFLMFVIAQKLTEHLQPAL